MKIERISAMGKSIFTYRTGTSIAKLTSSNWFDLDKLIKDRQPIDKLLTDAGRDLLTLLLTFDRSIEAVNINGKDELKLFVDSLLWESRESSMISAVEKLVK